VVVGEAPLGGMKQTPTTAEDVRSNSAWSSPLWTKDLGPLPTVSFGEQCVIPGRTGAMIHFQFICFFEVGREQIACFLISLHLTTQLYEN